MDPLCGMMGYLDQTRKVNERRSGTEGKVHITGTGEGIVPDKKTINLQLLYSVFLIS